MALVLIIGFIIIFSSYPIGESIGDNAVQRNGGSMDTSKYERIIQTNTSNFQTVGFVLSLVGGFGILLSGYALYQEL